MEENQELGMYGMAPRASKFLASLALAPQCLANAWHTLRWLGEAIYIYLCMSVYIYIYMYYVIYFYVVAASTEMTGNEPETVAPMRPPLLV